MNFCGLYKRNCSIILQKEEHRILVNKRVLQQGYHLKDNWRTHKCSTMAEYIHMCAQKINLCHLLPFEWWRVLRKFEWQCTFHASKTKNVWSKVLHHNVMLGSKWSLVFIVFDSGFYGIQRKLPPNIWVTYSFTWKNSRINTQFMPTRHVFNKIQILFGGHCKIFLGSSPLLRL